MKSPASPTVIRPDIALSYWLALCAALISFAIVSGQLLFAGFIGLGSIALKSISPTASKRTREGAQILFTFSTYLAALLPLWPNPYSDYYYSPIALILGVALIAALNQQSHGGSRGVTSIAAIAFLLFARNVVLYFDFKTPVDELSTSLAFVGLMENALSNRYRKNKDNPHPELVFGLSIALVASFSFTSLLLGIVLAALPITAFLIRNHELAQIANEHTRAAKRITPEPKFPRRTRARAILAGLPIAAASLIYLTLLQTPFWGNFLPSDAPYLAKSIAQKAATLSNASNLDDEVVQDLTNKMVDPSFFKAKATEFAGNWKRPRTETESPDQKGEASLQSRTSNYTREDTESRPYDADNFEYRLGPFARNRNNATSSDLPTRPYESGIQGQFPRRSDATSSKFSRQRFDTSNPPTPDGLTPGIPNGIDTDYSNLADSSERETESSQSNLATGPAPSQDDTPSPSEDFDQFIAAFEQPEKAITQALNLEGSDVSALLSEEALATVKLESSRAAPRRLYLRRNVLDTVDRNGLGGRRSQEGRVELSTNDDQIIPLRTFRQSKSKGSTLTITSNQSRNPTLPLPESFGSIQVFGTETMHVYPEERVTISPRSRDPITYRVFEADLEITDRERKTNGPSAEYRERMLEIPLSQSDRDYLENLANRVGGSRSPTRKFAYRFANYFANRHPYSYFVTIPPGPGHSVVRWLENECSGLCSNYAAAFTLLARSRGIPARVVGGFASDEFDSKESRFIMRQSNAHAWVEYLDESNRWIRFDPTPGITEAEIRRAAPYASAGNPQSLQRLIANETKATQEPLPTTEKAFPEPQPAQPDLADSPTIASKPDPTPQQDPPPARASSAAPEKPSLATTPPPRAKPQQSTSKQSLTQTTPPSSNKAAPREAPPPAEERNAPASPSAPPPPDPNSQNPPWLFLLAILALVIPSIAYLMSLKKPKAASPELQLRHKAGRLLAQLDTLLQQHDLSHDPIWIETRQTLSEQRYGRETDPIMVQDLAVKVALLSKRKKGK